MPRRTVRFHAVEVPRRSLTIPEIASFVARIQGGLAATGDSPKAIGLRATGITARNDLALANLPLIPMVIARYPQQDHHPFDDLFQSGFLGLLRSCEKYDPDRGTQFSTYAVLWIRAEIGHFCDQQSIIHIPRHIYQLRDKIRKAGKLLRQRTGKADFATACQVAGLTDQQIEMVRKSYQPVMLANDLGHAVEPGGTEQGDQQRVSKASEVLDSLLGSLDTQDRQILCGRHSIGCDEPLQMKDLGRQHGIDRNRVHAIERRAIDRLRAVAREDRGMRDRIDEVIGSE